MSARTFRPVARNFRIAGDAPRTAEFRRILVSISAILGSVRIARRIAGDVTTITVIASVTSGSTSAFGRHFISNPDLPLRIREHFPLTDYDRNTFYTFDAKGYSTTPPTPKPPHERFAHHVHKQKGLARDPGVSGLSAA